MSSVCEEKCARTKKMCQKLVAEFRKENLSLNETISSQILSLEDNKNTIREFQAELSSAAVRELQSECEKPSEGCKVASTTDSFQREELNFLFKEIAELKLNAERNEKQAERDKKQAERDKKQAERDKKQFAENNARSDEEISKLKSTVQVLLHGNRQLRDIFLRKLVYEARKKICSELRPSACSDSVFFDVSIAELGNLDLSKDAIAALFCGSRKGNEVAHNVKNSSQILEIAVAVTSVQENSAGWRELFRYSFGECPEEMIFPVET